MLGRLSPQREIKYVTSYTEKTRKERKQGHSCYMHSYGEGGSKGVPMIELW